MAEPELKWADVAAAGGIREWVDAETARQGLADPGVPSAMTDAEKKLYKARREEERRVRRELFRKAWNAYKRVMGLDDGASAPPPTTIRLAFPPST